MAECHVLVIYCSLCLHPSCLPFVALASGDAVALTLVSHGDLWLFWPDLRVPKETWIIRWSERCHDVRFARWPSPATQGYFSACGYTWEREYPPDPVHIISPVMMVFFQMFKMPLMTISKCQPHCQSSHNDIRKEFFLLLEIIYWWMRCCCLILDWEESVMFRRSCLLAWFAF